MNPSPLDVPELLDHCLSFLQCSATALRACSLVSRLWAYPAQSRLFAGFSIVRRQYSASKSYEKQWALFRRSLDASPRLILHIRHLEVELPAAEVATLSQICDFPFVNLVSVSLWVTGAAAISEAIATVIRRLLRHLTLRRLKLRGVFRAPQDFSRVWGSSPHQVAPAVAGIEVLDISAAYLEAPFSLALFSNLIHLRLRLVTARTLPGLLPTLGTIIPATMIRTITLDIHQGGPGLVTCQRLDLALSTLSLPSSLVPTLVIETGDPTEGAQFLRAFPWLRAKNLIRVSVTHPS
ncbi:hypothetical protein C8R47DRAFT_1162358 [Mycena vitilis]|nr:hypothetical protein C8R47DRAFT_1162358 [Mycena vitilis]